jgi:hypothetical protein
VLRFSKSQSDHQYAQFCIWDNDQYGPAWGYWGSSNARSEILVNSAMNFYNRFPGGSGYYSLASGSVGPYDCNFFGLSSLACLLGLTMVIVCRWILQPVERLFAVRVRDVRPSVSTQPLLFCRLF